MENATKALIIAAAVLIVIILIAVSLKVLGSTQRVTRQSDTTSSNSEISMFNSKFESFLGKKVNGSSAKQLVSRIIISNSQNPQHIVRAIYGLSEKGDLIWAHNPNAEDFNSKLQDIYNILNNSDKYNISITRDCEDFTNGYDNGYIACIRILPIY